MSNVIPFKFDAREVRTMLIDDQPWFVAADVCASLAIGNVSLAVNGRADRGSDGLDEDEKGIATVNTPSGAQEMLVVNESGLYALIFKSRKAEAKRFKKWVTAEVLPAIRKTGGYHVAANGEFAQGAIREFQGTRLEMVQNVTNMTESSLRLAGLLGFEGNQGRLYADKLVKRQLGIGPMELLGVTGLVNQEQELHYTATELGKKHGMSANSMNKLLAQVGLQRRFEYAKGKHRWELTAEGRKHGVILDTAKRHSDGTPVQQIRWRESVLQVLQGLARQLQATLPAVARG